MTNHPHLDGIELEDALLRLLQDDVSEAERSYLEERMFEDPEVLDSFLTLEALQAGLRTEMVTATTQASTQHTFGQHLIHWFTQPAWSFTATAVAVVSVSYTLLSGSGTKTEAPNPVSDQPALHSFIPMLSQTRGFEQSQSILVDKTSDILLRIASSDLAGASNLTLSNGSGETSELRVPVLEGPEVVILIPNNWDLNAQQELIVSYQDGTRRSYQFRLVNN